jgi:O-antigen/teichoic acid export membrane protein
VSGSLPSVAQPQPGNLQPGRSLTHKTASGVAWISLFQIARQLLQVASVSILARKVPPSAYGLVAMAALLTAFLEMLRDAGTGYALIREREVSEELVSTVFWLTCGLGLAFSLIIIALSVPAAHFFHEPQVARILQWLAVSFVAGALSTVPAAMLNREMAFRKLAVSQTIGAVAGTIVAIAVALAGGKVWALVVGSIVTNVVTTIAIFYAASMRIRPLFRPADASHIVSFGLNLSGFNLVNYFSRNADNLLVGKFLGSLPLGFYQMGYMLMTYPIQNFSSVVAQVVYPALSKIHDDSERFCAAYLRMCRVIGLVTFPVMLGLAVTAQPFVRVFLGPRWAPVAGLLIIFGPLGAAQSIYTTAGLIYNTKGRPDVQLKWGMFAGAIYVLSFIIGLHWGIIGVAGCYAAAWFLLMVPSFVIPFRLVGLSVARLFATLWPTIWMALVMTAVCECWRQMLLRVGSRNALVDLVSTVVVGIVIYSSLLLWRRPQVLTDLATILEGTRFGLARKVAAFLGGGAQPASTSPSLN